MPDSTPVAYFDRYVEAWNEHDPEAVMAQFADGGTYVDPASDGTLSGKNIGEHVEGLATAFPDYHFAEGRRSLNEEGILFAEWMLHGTHHGPLQGLPPTHRTIEVDGVDVVKLSEEGITSIAGYYDMSDFNEQLGLTFPAVVGQLPKLALGAVRNVL